jgi:hypothetical protein
LIDPFVMTAEDDEMSRGGKGGGGVVDQAGLHPVDMRTTLHVVAPSSPISFFSALQLLDRSENRLTFHDHSLAAAVGRFIGGAMSVLRPIAQSYASGFPRGHAVARVS